MEKSLLHSVIAAGQMYAVLSTGVRSAVESVKEFEEELQRLKPIQDLISKAKYINFYGEYGNKITKKTVLVENIFKGPKPDSCFSCPCIIDHYCTEHGFEINHRMISKCKKYDDFKKEK